MFTLNFQTINSQFLVTAQQGFMGDSANIRPDFLMETLLFFLIRQTMKY
jgi:hypothetical protein